MNPDAHRPNAVVETPFFIRKAAALLGEDERWDLIGFLAANPDAGDIVPETGGVRKVRWAVKVRGKRGGVRVVYYYRNELFPLFLLNVYAKSQKADLTSAERSEFKTLTAALVKTYARGKQS
jgi:mRNA-degrading endonuclease RelE of RelBE toxin-antitoxin system